MVSVLEERARNSESWEKARLYTWAHLGRGRCSHLFYRDFRYMCLRYCRHIYFRYMYSRYMYFTTGFRFIVKNNLFTPLRNSRSLVPSATLNTLLKVKFRVMLGDRES